MKPTLTDQEAAKLLKKHEKRLFVNLMSIYFLQPKVTKNVGLTWMVKTNDGIINLKLSVFIKSLVGKEG